MLTLQGRVAMVTGAAGGIGKATANALAQLKAKVALVDIPAKEKELKEIARTIGEKWGVECRPYFVDISEESSVEKLFDAVSAE